MINGKLKPIEASFYSELDELIHIQQKTILKINVLVEYAHQRIANKEQCSDEFKTMIKKMRRRIKSNPWGA